MSIIASILGVWNGVPSWVRTLIMYAIVALGAMGTYAAWSIHKVDEGKAEQRAADKALYAKQTAKAAADQAAAEKTREDELNTLRAYRDSHPVGPVRLCLHSVALSGAPKADLGSPATGNVLDVPAPNSGSGAGNTGPDIGSMLEILAGKADAVSAELRKEQTK